MKKYFVGENFQSTKQEIKPKLDESARLFGRWKITTNISDKTSPNGVLIAKQVHSGNIVKSNHLELSKVEADGITLPSESTNRIGIYTADCVPIVMMTDNMAIALHVSRKSIVRGLMDNVMSFISPTEVNYVYIGPHICEYHFSFDEEDYMIRKFRYRFPEAIHFHKGLLYLSLKKALLHFFDEWKINKDRVIFDGRCNYEMLNLPSYRRWKQSGEEGNMQRILTVIEKHP